MNILIIFVLPIAGILAAPPLMSVYRPPAVHFPAVPSHHHLQNFAYQSVGSIAAPHHFAAPSTLAGPLNTLLHLTSLPVGQLYNPVVKAPLPKMADIRAPGAPVVYRAPFYPSYPVV